MTSLVGRRVRGSGAAPLRIVERLTQCGLPKRATAKQFAAADELREWWIRTYLRGNRRLSARVLKRLGTSGRRFLRALMTDCVLPPAHMPTWMRVSRQALKQLAPNEPGEATDFTPLVRPFAVWASAKFAQDLRSHPDPNLDVDALCEQFHAVVEEHLLFVASRTCLLELNDARLLGQLGAASPGERFQQFVRDFLSSPRSIRLFLDRYPVLERLLATASNQALAAWSEMTRRLRADWNLVHKTFALDDENLRRVDSGLGDPHREGRSVMILTFASGRKVVYKPRSVAIESHFSNCIAWFNARGLVAPLRRLVVLPREDYGWVEYIEPKPCETSDDIQAFYRRQGALLALTYFLDGTDCHNENLIAHGADPVLVDVETLFHNLPPATRVGRDRAAVRRTTVYAETVLRTGLLPQKIFGPEGSAELSGLKGAGGQTSPFSVPRFEQRLTDEMHIVYGKVQMGPAHNLPRLGELPVDVGEVDDIFIGGFSEMYRLAMQHRSQFLAPDGPVEAFRQDRVRFVPRPTYEYAALLSDSLHPALMRDAVRRDFHLDILWQTVPEQKFLEDLVESEQQDLWQGDIPYFEAGVGETDLFDSRKKRIEGFFQQPAIARVRCRIAALSERDLDCQTHCIRMSIAAARATGGGAVPTAQLAAGAATTPSELLAAATDIGEWLLRYALAPSGDQHWISLQPVNETDYIVEVAADDFYSGNAGIAVFLAHLAKQTGRGEFQSVARAVLRRAISNVCRPHKVDSIGAFHGPLSVLYAALHGSAIWGENSVIEPFEALQPAIARHLRRDRKFDLLGGAAGCILVLLRWFRRNQSEELLGLAVQAGDHLLKSSVKLSAGIGWPSPADGPPLTGVSHGVAGIAWALAELGVMTKRDKYLDAAAAALVYERSLFDSGTQNWADLRPASEGGSPSAKFLWAWCHGAPGIGTARLMMRRVWPEADVDDEIATAIRSTLSNGFGGSHSLCHGDLGNADFLVSAAHDLHQPEWAREALRAASRVLEQRNIEGRFRCGVGGFEETPDFMVGLAGIGYGLLRLANPRAVPSVLGLEIPSPN
ncbi:MAG: type 2 lantipeptide synthetase LanM [Rhizobiales bacterium]|nr:type 2 lantipeptide synthetase LanM [Hyphomicrobiales bacterium]